MRCVEPRTDARCGFLIYTGDVQRFHGLLDAADLVCVQVEILSHLGSLPVFQELAHCQPDTVPGFTLCKALCFVFPYVSLYQSEYIR